MRIRRLCELTGLGIVAAVSLAACATGAGPTVGAPAASTPVSPSSSVAAAPPSPQASPGASPSASAAAAPSALRVECTETGTSVATDQVAAQPDGVHFQVRSVSKGRAFQIADVGGDNAPAPEGVLTWALPPGEIRIWCGPTDPTDSDWVAVRVVDPLDVYVPAQLTCASSAHGSVDYAAGARGERGDPVAITKRHLRLGPGDTVEPAGYPATADREVRVMHDGSIVMLATFTPDDHGGWLLSSTDTCAKSDIHWGS